MDAIKLYKGIIRLADREDDITTRRLFEEILGDEEGHLDTFKTLLKMK
ncbi:MAG: ferritin-like domain-containing protein [candidate division Zixibacteria bacterium]|nr:ferritin-like domain-containing protein [candidate division Zixibacteria bacterium]